MKKIFDLWRRPLPHLGAGQALLLRLLMLPNLFLIRVEGEEQLEKHGSTPCIYAFNHNNAFESLFVPVMLIWLLGGRRVSFVIDWMFGRLPVVGWLMKQIDPVYVYHKRSTLPFLERTRPEGRPADIRSQCLARLAAGRSIGIFPEGTRNGDPFRLLKAKPGIGYIALESGAPVIPAGIEFTASRKRSRIPFIGRMTLRIGEPIIVDGQLLTDEQCQGENPKVRRARLAGELSFEVMSAISELCGKSYPYRELNEPAINRTKPVEALCPS